MIRVGVVLDWNLYASSLMGIARNLFRELGKLMNEKRSFTIAGIKLNDIKIGDINQRFDCIHIPNMGGYKFPVDESNLCKNLILGPSGIDEVIYGKDVMIKKSRWKEQEQQIKEDIENNPIILYMKGTKEMPMCGFSNSVVQVLNHYGVDYKDINILEDPNIRIKLSEHSGWPTIPQLFVKGELIGGADITVELHQNGQLLDILDKAIEK